MLNADVLNDPNKYYPDANPYDIDWVMKGYTSHSIEFHGDGGWSIYIPTGKIRSWDEDYTTLVAEGRLHSVDVGDTQLDEVGE